MKDEPRSDSDLILYQTEDGRTRLQVRLEGETVWLSLNQMADLFQRDKSVISRHIKNVFDEGELAPTATVAKSATEFLCRRGKCLAWHDMGRSITIQNGFTFDFQPRKTPLPRTAAFLTLILVALDQN